MLQPALPDSAVLERELFEVILPFWDRYGVDHEFGGFLCGLDHDGARVHTRKFHWFQGRGIWVYSFLYNHFGRDPKHLEIARKGKDFLLAHFLQPRGFAEVVSREGEVLTPFRGSPYGMYFAVEGLQEYAWAAGDEQALQTALSLFSQLQRRPAEAEQDVWMLDLLIATQMLKRWKPPGIAEIADRAVDAIMQLHYNPETGLNMERRSEPQLCVFGHSIECLWMVMEEAQRRGDHGLWELASERVRKHLDAGWDPVHGGLAAAVNSGHPEHEWVDRPVETGLEFHHNGEHNYTKSFWSINEVQIATLNIYLPTGAEWALRYYTLAQEVRKKKFSLRDRGLPLYLLFTDREFSFQPRTWRQDNYHPPRQLMLNLLALKQR